MMNSVRGVFMNQCCFSKEMPRCQSDTVEGLLGDGPGDYLSGLGASDVDGGLGASVSLPSSVSRRVVTHVNHNYRAKQV